MRTSLCAPIIDCGPPVNHFDACPKCAHEPLPEDQRLPAACPGCGVILAKLGSMDEPPRAEVEEYADIPADGFVQRFRDAIGHVPERVDRTVYWCRCVILVLFALWGLRLIALDYRTGEMMGSFLHGPLLVFHEAGHVIFSVLGEFIMVLGGSLAQLVMPAILATALLIRNRDPFGAAIGLWFCGVSLLDLAPYVYDSLHPQLILLGGHTGEEGGHDWIYLLRETGLLQHAQGIGALTHLCGAVVVVIAIGWAGWILYRQRTRLVADAVRFD